MICRLTIAAVITVTVLTVAVIVAIIACVVIKTTGSGKAPSKAWMKADITHSSTNQSSRICLNKSQLEESQCHATCTHEQFMSLDLHWITNNTPLARMHYAVHRQECSAADMTPDG